MSDRDAHEEASAPLYKDRKVDKALIRCLRTSSRTLFWAMETIQKALLDALVTAGPENATTDDKVKALTELEREASKAYYAVNEAVAAAEAILAVKEAEDAVRSATDRQRAWRRALRRLAND